MLAVVTFRPEFAPPWSGPEHVAAIALSRLGRRQGEVIVEGVTGGRALPAEVADQIVARTDGVPLFIEELTKAVLETGLLREEEHRYVLDGPLPPLAIPDTLQDSLLARLDRLAAAKEVAQVAAVIGREFDHDAARRGHRAGGDGARGTRCNGWSRPSWCSRAARRPRPPTSFKHALVRDAAYESLLLSRRRKLHEKVASLLEERFPEAAAAEPELLARHCAGAGLAARAVDHWRRAAELAVGRSANLEAIAYCEEASAQLRTLPPSPEGARAELEILLAKGTAVRAGQGYSAPEAERVFARACELCEGLGERVRLVHALRGLWAFYYVAGRFSDAAQVADRLDAAADGLADGVALTVREYVVGVTRLYRGEPVVASGRLREALRLYDEPDRDAHIRQSGQNAASQVRGHLMLAQWFLGLPGQALRTSDEGLAIARRAAHPFSLAQMLAFGAILRVLTRDWGLAQALAAEARACCTRYGLVTHRALGTMAAGMAQGSGHPADAIGLIQDGMAALRRTGGGFFIPLALVHLALARCATGDADAAVAAADEAVWTARATEEFCWEAEALRVLGEVKRAAGAEADGVEADLLAAVGVAQRQGARSFALRAATSLARLRRDQGRCPEARDLLAPLYGWFTEGLDTPDLVEARTLLDAL